MLHFEARRGVRRDDQGREVAPGFHDPFDPGAEGRPGSPARDERRGAWEVRGWAPHVD